MLEFFQISENFTVPTAAQLAAGATFRPEYHGENGHLTTGYLFNLPNGSIHNASQQTWESLGYEVNLDPNDGETHGFGVFPSTVDRDANIREDAARAYYQPIESRSNLKIIKGTMTKMTWENGSDDGLVASGVEYLDSSGQLLWIGASKDVIISAGTLRSPLALEASGIGNPRYANIMTLTHTPLLQRAQLTA
jgi:choline dehydrogenase